MGNDLKLVTAIESKETINHIISTPSPTNKTNGVALQLDTVEEREPEDVLCEWKYLPGTFFISKNPFCYLKWYLSSYFCPVLEKPNHTPTLKRAISCDSIMSNSSVAADSLESPHHCGEIELGLEYDA